MFGPCRNTQKYPWITYFDRVSFGKQRKKNITFDLPNNQHSWHHTAGKWLSQYSAGLRSLFYKVWKCQRQSAPGPETERARAVSAADICGCKISLVINHKAIIGWCDERRISGKVFLDVFNRCWVVWSVGRSCLWFGGHTVQQRLIHSWYVRLPRIQLIRLLLFLSSTIH